MNVQQEFPNDPTVWRVESQSRPGQHHIVELLNFEAFGECTCEHFQCRLGPGLRAGFAEKPCDHITAAKLAFADVVLEQMIKNLVSEASRPRS